MYCQNASMGERGKDVVSSDKFSLNPHRFRYQYSAPIIDKFLFHHFINVKQLTDVVTRTELVHRTIDVCLLYKEVFFVPSCVEYNFLHSKKKEGILEQMDPTG